MDKYETKFIFCNNDVCEHEFCADELERAIKEIAYLDGKVTHIKKQDDITIRGHIAIIKKLEAQNKKLREALEFYASTNSWGNSGNKSMNRAFYADCSYESFDRDGFHYHKVATGGKIARKTLKEIGEWNKMKKSNN